jgi:thiamine biosynthesis lipoprotein
MGTRCDVVLFDVNHEFGKQLFQILKKEVERLEAKLSSAVFDSPVGILNRAQKNIWLDVDPELWEILTLCFDFYQLSNGAFDITISQLVNLWKNEGKEIDTGQILKAKNSSGFDKIELDINKQKLKFLTDHVEFNIGGIVKAYTLDSLNGIFKKQGVTNAIISFGESSVLALGNHPNGNVWPLVFKMF